MAIIREATLEQKEVRNPNPDSFEEIQDAKAKLFHTKKEAFLVLGIGRRLAVALVMIGACISLAFVPIIRDVTDLGAAVVPEQLVHVEALKYGRIAEVFVKETDFVEKGKALARVVNPDDEREIREAESEAKLIEAERQGHDTERFYWFERLEADKRLNDKRVISSDEFKQTELAFKGLENKRETLKMRLAWLKEKIQFLEAEKERGILKAPVSGKVISDVESATGSFVAKGDFVLTLASGDPMIEFLLREEDYGRVGPADEARVRFYAFPGKRFTGKVVRVKHYAEAVDLHGYQTAAIKVLIKLHDIPVGIRNGMSAKVVIKGRPVSVIEHLRRRI